MGAGLLERVVPAASTVDRPERPPRRRSWPAPVALLGLAVLLRVPQLGHGLNEEFAFRQTQTAWLARAYAVGGIDLRHSPLPIFGARTDLPFEFPLVQAVAAVLIRLGLTPDTAMRTVSLVAFVAVGALLTVLVTRWHGRRVALVALAVLTLSPFGLEWGASSLIELPAVALSLAMVLALDSWFRGARAWTLAVALLCGVLAFLVKATTGPVWCVLVGLAGLATLSRVGFREGWRRVLAGWATVFPALVAGVAWTSYADRVKSAQPLAEPFVSARLTSWTYGTLDQRTDPDVWARVLQRVSTEIVGPFGLVVVALGLAAVLVSRGSDRLLGLGWLLTVLAGPLMFTNLYYVHSYYLLAVFPAICVLVGLGVEATARLAGRFTSRAVVPMTVLALVLVASSHLTSFGRLDVGHWRTSPAPPPAAAKVRAVVPVGEAVVYAHCDWNPTTPYYVDRDALMLRSTDDARTAWADGSADYRWIYSCTSAPVDAYLPPGTTASPTGVTGLYAMS